MKLVFVASPLSTEH